MGTSLRLPSQDRASRGGITVNSIRRQGGTADEDFRAGLQCSSFEGKAE